MDRWLEVGLFRHGATDWNLEGRLQGVTDTQLSELGRQQVRRAAEHLSAESWDLVISSPLLRARASAEILATTLGLPAPEILPLVTERSFGIGEGMRYPEWFELQALGTPVAGAESDAEVDIRVESFLSDMSSFSSSRVLVVSHGGFIRRVIRRLSDDALPPADARLQNASLQRISTRGQGWIVSEWNPQSLGTD